MRPDEYMAFDGTALADLVRRGEVTAQALTEAAIERIESLNGPLNAVVERGYAQGRAAALEVGNAAPLCGVPFLAKDLNIDVAGLHLTYSCRWLKDLPPASQDAPLAARWRAAGLCILGRTNTPEWAAEFVTEPTWRGPTRNPWDRTLSPGGSSGGSAAAVSSGMVPIAHGTDSGGSIRVPASACGLVGLKPSRGWVPVGPHLDELAGGLDCEHVLTRTVRDSAMMLQVTSGAESTSRVPLRSSGDSFVEALKSVPSPLRIGVVLEAPGGKRPNDEIGRAVEEMARFLGRAGHTVGSFRFPDSANIGDAALVIWLTAIAEEIEFYQQRVGRSPEAEELEALTWESIAAGKRSTAIDYVRSRRALAVATRDMAEAAKHFDLLLLPTTADHAPRIGQIDGRTAAFNLDRWNADSYGYAPYTEIFNATGSLPFRCRSRCPAPACRSAFNSPLPSARTRDCSHWPPGSSANSLGTRGSRHFARGSYKVFHSTRGQ